MTKNEPKDLASGGGGHASEERAAQEDGDQAAHLPGTVAPPRRPAARGLCFVVAGEERPQADRPKTGGHQKVPGRQLRGVAIARAVVIVSRWMAQVYGR